MTEEIEVMMENVKLSITQHLINLNGLITILVMTMIFVLWESLALD